MSKDDAQLMQHLQTEIQVSLNYSTVCVTSDHDNDSLFHTQFLVKYWDNLSGTYTCSYILEHFRHATFHTLQHCRKGKHIAVMQLLWLSTAIKLNRRRTWGKVACTCMRRKHLLLFFFRNMEGRRCFCLVPMVW